MNQERQNDLVQITSENEKVPKWKAILDIMFQAKDQELT